ncbi:MAG: dihydroorotase, partial [bacterium]
MTLRIINARVIDPASGRDAAGDVFIERGRIAALDADARTAHAERTLDAAGLVVAPGLIDLAARQREQGEEYKATLESEM